MAFAALVSIFASVLIALLPAWRIAKSELQDALRASGKAATGDRAATRTRGVLLALQVGLSVTLLVVTALLSVSFIRLMNVDRGFDADRVLAVGVSMPAARYVDDRARLAAYDRLLADVHALPGVQSATTSSMVPLAGEGQVNFVRVEGDTRPMREQPTANFRLIASAYFKTMGVSVVRGRAFTDAERDPNRPAPTLISASVAARLWPGQDAMGKRFSRGQPDEQNFEVVGIVADARTTSLEAAPPLMVYVPYWWRSRPTLTLLVRTAGDPLALMPGVRRVVRDIDPEIALGQARPLDQIVDAAFAARRYQVRLFVAFGVAALLIAMVGVYAVTAYGVSRRRREMNIRVALGAQASQVLSMIVRQASAPILAGVAAGAAGAIAIGGIVASLLFDVRARDPIVIAVVVALVAGVGVLACLLAARTSLSLNPSAALREE
jgi:putative ABC transport system permease protein